MTTVCGTCCSSKTIKKIRKRDLNTYDLGRIHIHISYIFVYTDLFSEPISNERILDQTLRLNYDFNANNMDLEKVPKSGKYSYFNLVGNCNIHFSVSDYSFTTAKKTYFESLSSIKSFLKLKSVSAPVGNLKIYITRLGNGILGEAHMFSDCLVVDHRTIGGASFHGDGSFQNYNTGRTLTHEVGHVLGLPHTFDSNCEIQFEDIPPQKNPNFDAYLFQNATGVWDGVLDNRFRDCNQPLYNIPFKAPPYGCDSQCLTEYEMFFNFMDYCDDHNSIMFTQKQADFMRQSVLDGDTKLKVRENEISTDVFITELEPNKNDSNILYIVLLLSMFLFLTFFCTTFRVSPIF